MAAMTVPHYDTLIVGAGFSGIGTAIKLDKAGLTDYLIIEAGDGPGGTGTGTRIPVSPLTSRRSPISSRSRRTRTGRARTRAEGN
jgi:cation diffusion facilitator CzcD-associated flavoprotein CzcO